MVSKSKNAYCKLCGVQVTEVTKDKVVYVLEDFVDSVPLVCVRCMDRLEKELSVKGYNVR